MEWYDEPLYPILSLIIGVSSYDIVQRIRPNRKLFQIISFQKTILSIIVLLILVFPFKSILQNVSAQDRISYPWQPDQTDIFRINGAYLQYLHSHMPHEKQFTVYKMAQTEPKDYQTDFYRTIYNDASDTQIQLAYSLADLNPNEKVIVCDAVRTDSLNESFTDSIINQWNGCKLVLLKKRK